MISVHLQIKHESSSQLFFGGEKYKTFHGKHGRIIGLLGKLKVRLCFGTDLEVLSYCSESCSPKGEKLCVELLPWKTTGVCLIWKTKLLCLGLVRELGHASKNNHKFCVVGILAGVFAFDNSIAVGFSAALQSF